MLIKNQNVNRNQELNIGGRIPPKFENIGKSFQFRTIKLDTKLKTFCILAYIVMKRTIANSEGIVL